MDNHNELNGLDNLPLSFSFPYSLSGLALTKSQLTLDSIK
jgi:hypothetical protein